jgi:hypothetical protein
MTGVIFENNFDQANGVAITTANSGGSGNAFGSVSTTNLALTYSTEQKAHGTASMKVTPGATGNSAGYVIPQKLGLPTTYSWRLYFRLTGLPSAAMNLLMAYVAPNPNNQNHNLLNINTDGRISFTAPTADGVGHTYSIPVGSFAASLNHWYRAEGTVVMDATNGSMLLNIYDGDATTPLVTSNPTGIFTGSPGSGVQQFQMGKGTSSPVIAPYYLDALKIRNDATAIGPYVAALPSVIANASIAGSTLNLSAVASTYDNAAPTTFAWTQTGGPSVLTGTATTATVSETLTIGGTYSFHLDITDDLGRHATDDVSYTYAGDATSGPAVTGTTASNQWVETLQGTPAASGALSWSISPSTGVTLTPVGNSCIASGPTPAVATAYTATCTEAGNANTTQFRFTVPGSPSAAGGGIRILRASDDQTNGGSFS